MLELVNETAWSAGLFPGWNAQRHFQYTLVVKQSYRFDESGVVEPLDTAEPICEADRHRGEPHTSSLVAASEIAPFKVGAEWYLYGTAIPRRQGVRAMAVRVVFTLQGGGSREKRLQVIGERQWERGLLGQRMGEAAPLQPTPLIYENAFGGGDPDDDERRFPGNPVGRGYNPGNWRVTDRRLPLIEQGRPQTSPFRAGRPAGFGPLPVFWEPRRSAFGTPVEDPDAQGGCPDAPDAAPDRYNVAPADQRRSRPFGLDETLTLEGFFAGVDSVQLSLPFELPGAIQVSAQGRSTLIEMACDTLVIDTDEKRLHRIFRGALPARRTSVEDGWVQVREAPTKSAPLREAS